MYFLHSYFVKFIINEEIESSYVGIEYTSGLRKENIFAFQFHPEKVMKMV